MKNERMTVELSPKGQEIVEALLDCGAYESKEEIIEVGLKKLVGEDEEKIHLESQILQELQARGEEWKKNPENVISYDEFIAHMNDVRQRLLEANQDIKNTSKAAGNSTLDV